MYLVSLVKAGCNALILTQKKYRDKILASAYCNCETEITRGADPKTEQALFGELLRLTEKELFDRCKEIFHTSFKTRKAGKEALNPIRDGKGAFRGRMVNERILRFVRDLEAVMKGFGKIVSEASRDLLLTVSEPEIRSHRSSRAEWPSNHKPYMNEGRLVSIFLADFLDH
jgi:hypothetical protein